MASLACCSLGPGRHSEHGARGESGRQREAVACCLPGLGVVISRSGAHEARVCRRRAVETCHGQPCRRRGAEIDLWLLACRRSRGHGRHAGHAGVTCRQRVAVAGTGPWLRVCRQRVEETDHGTLVGRQTAAGVVEIGPDALVCRQRGVATCRYDGPWLLACHRMVVVCCRKVMMAGHDGLLGRQREVVEENDPDERLCRQMEVVEETGPGQLVWCQREAICCRRVVVVAGACRCAGLVLLLCHQTVVVEFCREVLAGRQRRGRTAVATCLGLRVWRQRQGGGRGGGAEGTWCQTVAVTGLWLLACGQLLCRQRGVVGVALGVGCRSDRAQVQGGRAWCPGGPVGLAVCCQTQARGGAQNGHGAANACL